MKQTINVTRSSMPDFEEYIDEIKDLWETCWLTNMGDKHKALESKLEEYLNVPNITLFTNGYLSLEHIINALKLSGEVITTPFTFAATTHAIVRNGLKPVFCDINYDDYTIDVDNIESLITDKTSAIMPVHVYGNICDIERIDQIAKKHNLKVIYDAAHTFGMTVNGRGIGSFGDASIFSFHATKVFHTIEGGAVTYGDASIKPILNGLKNYGINESKAVEYVGGNAKMNEFQAAMGICNLRHVDDEIDKRRKAAERYVENLKDIEGIKLYSEKEGIKRNYTYFPVVFDGYKKTRDEVLEELESNNISTKKYFHRLTSGLECYKGQYDSDDTPTAKYIVERVLTLPLYAGLELEDVDRICEIIKK